MVYMIELIWVINVNKNSIVLVMTLLFMFPIKYTGMNAINVCGYNSFPTVGFPLQNCMFFLNSGQNKIRSLD